MKHNILVKSDGLYLIEMPSGPCGLYYDPYIPSEQGEWDKAVANYHKALDLAKANAVRIAPEHQQRVGLAADIPFKDGLNEPKEGIYPIDLPGEFEVRKGMTGMVKLNQSTSGNVVTELAYYKEAKPIDLNQFTESEQKRQWCEENKPEEAKPEQPSIGKMTYDTPDNGKIHNAGTLFVVTKETEHIPHTLITPEQLAQKVNQKKA